MRLRPLTFPDWPAVHTFARLDEVCRYQPWGPNTPEQTRTYVREAAAAWQQRPHTRYAYAVTADDTVIGTADLHLRPDRQAEIGYLISPQHWGRGIVTAAARQLITTAFEDHDIHRVYATCDPRNIGSARVLTKLGMRHEGRMRENMLIRDGWRDSDLYAVLHHEWTTR
ncbi:GNAT family protein [Actinoplanes sp. NBRC 101535]|uniref:GNAT family N-acetyltransferase n=1 Tax=Actinoplanes sp. NBRC 101535 TaxID=3032196 RepID=UPI00249FB1FF|nr:GNAT family protein [Actinoplanes sp. NBRC 101535]GLY02934.1 N-acetyltransferase [Actinoplanes sp. NBRC 101535]